MYVAGWLTTDNGDMMIDAIFRCNNREIDIQASKGEEPRCRQGLSLPPTEGTPPIDTSLPMEIGDTQSLSLILAD